MQKYPKLNHLSIITQKPTLETDNSRNSLNVLVQLQLLLLTLSQVVLATYNDCISYKISAASFLSEWGSPGKNFASTLGSVSTMAASADVVFLLEGIVVDSLF
jgi:hypothetical protein